MAVREFQFWSLDANGNGTVDADGLNAPVEGDYPLEPGEPAQVFDRLVVFLGT